MRGFNSLLGSHYDHYYLEYDFYDINEIPRDTFKIDPSKFVITAVLLKLFCEMYELYNGKLKV